MTQSRKSSPNGLKERPILFTAPMVRALLDGSKTQTRRVVKQELRQLGDGYWYSFDHKGLNYRVNARHTTVGAWAKPLQFCPYGQPGDRLWVRETFMSSMPTANGAVKYRADGAIRCGLGDFECETWKPSIHMPRRASRITLEIVSVRIERLNDIGVEDAEEEGCKAPDELVMELGCAASPSLFRKLWESINGAGSWEANPWVWVVAFRKVTA